MAIDIDVILPVAWKECQVVQTCHCPVLAGCLLVMLLSSQVPRRSGPLLLSLCCFGSKSSSPLSTSKPSPQLELVAQVVRVGTPSYTQTHTHTHARTHRHTHVYVYIYIHMYIPAHTHTHAYINIHAHTHVRTHVRTYMHACTPAYICTHTHSLKYIYICITYLHVYVRTIYIHIYIHIWCMGERMLFVCISVLAQTAGQGAGPGLPDCLRRRESVGAPAREVREVLGSEVGVGC